MIDFLNECITDNFYINTVGTRMLMFKGYRDTVDNKIQLLYRVRQCTPFQYYMYRWLGINLLAEDKFAWMKTCWKHKKVAKWLFN